MSDDADLDAWFCQEILPLEGALMRFIRRNWRTEADVSDIRQEIYERTLSGARHERPRQARAYLFTVARNHLVNRAKHMRIVSLVVVADLENLNESIDIEATERNLTARDELRRAQAGFDALPPKCREVVRLRKIEGLSRQDTAQRMGVTIATVEKQLTLGMRALVDFMLGGSGKIVRPRFDGRQQREQR
ncbi:MAG: RNA polymerase sigma factor [Sphingomonas taxi]